MWAGHIASDSTPVLTISQIADPSAFARTTFIEALVRAGIKVAAPPLGAAGALPDAGVYRDANRVAEYVSPPLSEFVKVILKVSYNRGADLMVCLAAVKAGSRDCGEGLAEVLKLLARTRHLANQHLSLRWRWNEQQQPNDGFGPRNLPPSDHGHSLGHRDPRRHGCPRRRWLAGAKWRRNSGGRARSDQGRRHRRRKRRRANDRDRHEPGRLHRRHERAPAWPTVCWSTTPRSRRWRDTLRLVPMWRPSSWLFSKDIDSNRS